MTATLRLNRSTLLAVVLLVQAGALLWQGWHLGITFDEPSHTADGFMYWRGRDFLPPNNTPRLMSILSGWIPLALHVPIQLDNVTSGTATSFAVGARTFSAMSAEDAHRLIFLMRLPFVAVALLTTWLIWHWARQLFGDTTALVLSLAAVLEPTLLGHGALVKSDVLAAFGALLFFYAAWRHWRDPCPRSLVWMSLALIVAITAKFTLLAFIPLAVLLVLWRGPRLLGPVVIMVAVYGAIAASYQFEMRPISKEMMAKLQRDGFSPAELGIARILGRLPWPAQFVEGLHTIGGADRKERIPGYMLGRRIEHGAIGYFPLAWVIKFPIALQLLVVGGLAVLIARIARHEAGCTDAFIWGPAALVMLLAMRSHIHIGVRHLLSAWPFFLLGAGFAIDWLWRRRLGRIAVSTCMAWLAIATAAIYPNGISYFNEWIGGPRNGWRYLADSNIDWGQNLPELARYVEQNRIERVHLYYFGRDIPSHYIAPEKIVPVVIPWRSGEIEARLVPKPGHHVISINLLLGYWFEAPHRDYFAAFRDREPDAWIGYSMLAFDIE